MCHDDALYKFTIYLLTYLLHFPYGNNCSAIDHVCKNRYTKDDYARALFVMELIMLKRDILRISDEFFDVQGTVINFVCSF